MTAWLHDEDGEAVISRDCLYATRVTYLHHVTCPHCGVRLAVSHELVPEFYASVRVTREEASDGKGQD